MTNQDEIILVKRDKKYKFLFQLISKDEMQIKVEEEKKDEIIPYSYQKLLTINDLPKRAGLAITDMRVALNQIKSSFKNNQLDFDLEERKNIKLYFYFFQEEEKEQIDIPVAFSTDDPGILHALSSKLSQSQKSFQKALNKIKVLQNNISSANAFNTKLKSKENFHKSLFNNQKHEIENIINQLKNYIKNTNDEINLNKKHYDDNFNEIKAQELSISKKIDAQTSSIEEYIHRKLLNLFNQIDSKINSNFQDKLNKDNSSLILNKLEVKQTIKTPHYINSVCLLKDKRLVSGGTDGIITVYNNLNKPQIEIKNAHEGWILSLCGLTNGDLASSSSDNMIKIWRIGDNDYKLIYTLKGHTDKIHKVIELKDGKICTCSSDKTIKVWDNNKLSGNYECIQTLTGHTGDVISITEMNDSIISASYKDETLRIWSQSTYECTKTIPNVYCCSENALEKLNKSKLLIGRLNKLIVVDIEFSGVKQLEDDTLGDVLCLRVTGSDLVYFGNSKGEICEYNPVSNQIISKSKVHNNAIYSLIETEENELISSSYDQTINIYEHEKKKKEKQTSCLFAQMCKYPAQKQNQCVKTFGNLFGNQSTNIQKTSLKDTKSNN